MDGKRFLRHGFAGLPAILQLCLHCLCRRSAAVRRPGRQGHTSQAPRSALPGRIRASSQSLQSENHALCGREPADQGPGHSMVDVGPGKMRYCEGSIVMKSILRAAVPAISAFWLSVMAISALATSALATSALAQISPGFRNSKIVLYEKETGDRGYWTTGLAADSQPLNPE